MRTAKILTGTKKTSDGRSVESNTFSLKMQKKLQGLEYNTVVAGVWRLKAWRPQVCDFLKILRR